MPIGRIVFLLFVVFSLRPLCAYPGGLPHHDLSVAIDPGESRLSATDNITLPGDRPETMTFRLHSGLKPQALSPDVIIEKVSEEDAVALYRVRMPPGRDRVSIRYDGRLFDALSGVGEGYARGFRQTRGQISETGVYLTGGSYWYPRFESAFLTFALRVALPEGWKSVSQGRRERTAEADGWSCAAPQEQIYLIAGRFSEYRRSAGRVEALVFLRQPDPGLADSYLEATAKYIALYEQMLGPYPYGKFALVENFWETGFGMPSFTLMGPRVIRFPFILHSSYPHEILHNWWGNSVYPDDRKGNWAEGLTAYLSDHLLKELRGQGSDYRHQALQKYSDYVTTEEDLPLTAFISRHSSATEAVGYGKGMMFFHMLKTELGEETFQKALRQFYRDYRFARADYDALQTTFEAAAGASLAAEFEQWVTRAGAPQLRLGKVERRPRGDGYRITADLEQIQDGAPYVLGIPVAVVVEGEEAARELRIVMDRKRQQFEWSFSRRPLQLTVDPRYDLFRRLAPAEIPPALSRVFGAKEVLAVLPAAAPAKRQAAYRAFAEALDRSEPVKIRCVLDRDLEALPVDRSVLLLGWDNRFRDLLDRALADDDGQVAPASATLAGQTVARADHAVVVTAHHPENPERVLAWIAAAADEALPGLARKLPHYHKYSYLVFRGSVPDNVAKGRWPVRRSPLTVLFE